MVKTPYFILIANGQDKSVQIAKNLISISFKDEANSKSDEITIKVAGEFKRPSYEDELKLSFGYKDEPTIFNCGTFIVQTTTKENDNVLTITATGADFTGSLKEKQNKTYESMSIGQIVGDIASRNGLNAKTDFDDTFILNLAQSDESDLHFLNKLAREHNAIFNIKNQSLIFKKKIKEAKKNESLPTYTIDKKDTLSLSIKTSSKTLYNSCKAIWQDTKQNKTKEIISGSGEPCINMRGTFKDEADAKLKADAKLQKANQGIVSGSLSIEGGAYYAGGKLNLVGTLEDDDEYQIKSINHTYNNSGWSCKIEFEK